MEKSNIIIAMNSSIKILFRELKSPFRDEILKLVQLESEGLIKHTESEILSPMNDYFVALKKADELCQSIKALIQKTKKKKEYETKTLLPRSQRI